MTLPAELKAKTVELVWEKDLSDYIGAKLGRPFRIQQNHYFGQDTIQTFDVRPDPEATAKVQEWLDSPRCMFPGRLDQNEPVGDHWNRPELGPDATLGESVDIYSGTILNELCNRGFLPEGDLTIHVWW